MEPLWRLTLTPMSASNPSQCLLTGIAALLVQLPVQRVVYRVWPWPSIQRRCVWSPPAALQATASAVTAALMREATETTVGRRALPISTLPAWVSSELPESNSPKRSSRSQPMWNAWDWTPGSHKRWRRERGSCSLTRTYTHTDINTPLVAPAFSSQSQSALRHMHAPVSLSLSLFLSLSLLSHSQTHSYLLVCVYIYIKYAYMITHTH